MVVVAFMMDCADQGTTLQSGQRLDLVPQALHGVSQFHFAEGHVLAPQPEGHVAAALRPHW